MLAGLIESLTIPHHVFFFLIAYVNSNQKKSVFEILAWMDFGERSPLMQP